MSIWQSWFFCTIFRSMYRPHRDWMLSAQDHGRHFHAQPPRDARDVMGNSREQQHLMNTPELPPTFSWVEAEYFHGRLGVGVEAQLLHAQLAEELFQGAHQVAQGDSPFMKPYTWWSTRWVPSSYSFLNTRSMLKCLWTFLLLSYWTHFNKSSY